MFPPPQNTKLCSDIGKLVRRVFLTTDVTKHVNKNNSDHSILFEAINLVLKYDTSLTEDIIKDTINLLSKFIAVKEPNIRCLALEALTKTKPHHMTT